MRIRWRDFELPSGVVQEPETATDSFRNKGRGYIGLLKMQMRTIKNQGNFPVDGKIKFIFQIQILLIANKMKTEIKKLEVLLEDGGDKDKIKAQLTTALKAIDKAAKCNVIHDNTAARKKSNIEKKAHKALA